MAKKLGIWGAVLFFHILFGLVLGQRNDALRPYLDSSRYLIVVSLISDHGSIHASKSIRADPVDILETEAILRKPIPVNPKPSMWRSAHSEGTAEPMRSSSQQPDNESSKKIQSLNYDAMEQAVRSFAHESPGRLLSGVTRKLSNAEKFSEAIEDAKRGDCRSEYAGIGLLAIPLLLKDTLTGEGCKW